VVVEGQCFLAIPVILSAAKDLVPFEGHEILRFAQNDRIRQDFLPDPVVVEECNAGYICERELNTGLGNVG